MSVVGLTATASGAIPNVTYHMSFQLRETSGAAGATILSVDFGFPDGGSAHADDPLVSATLAPSGTVQSKTFNIGDTSGQTIATQVTATVHYRADSGNMGTASATATITGPPTAPAPAVNGTLFGVVSDAASGSAISGASVSVTSGPNAGKSSVTDGNGYYSIPAITAGSFTIQVTASAYVTLTQTVSLNADTRVDLRLLKSVSAPPPVGMTCSAPAAAPSGSTAICNDGTFSSSQNRSGTCSSHGQVKCWICPGTLCGG